MHSLDKKKGQSRSTEELVITFSCAACAVIVAPFIVIRAMEDDHTLAVIDLIIVLGVSLIAFLTWIKRNVNLSRWLLAIYCAIAVTASVYAKGPISLSWVHPMMMLSFFLLRVRSAMLINLLVLLTLSPIILLAKNQSDVLVIIGSLIMTSIVAYIFASRTHNQQILLEQKATEDYLTESGNRRALSIQLRESVELMVRAAESTSLILMDLDFFKSVNDSYGHTMGDELLIKLCQLVRSNIRLTDRLYRYGGEEFVVVLRNTAAQEAYLIAEKLRNTISGYPLMVKYQVTASFGVAELKPDENETQWLTRVDSALYQSKKEGRNRTTLAE